MISASESRSVWQGAFRTRAGARTRVKTRRITEFAMLVARAEGLHRHQGDAALTERVMRLTLSQGANRKRRAPTRDRNLDRRGERRGGKPLHSAVPARFLAASCNALSAGVSVRPASAT